MGTRSAASGRPTTSSMLADDFTSHRTLFASPARWDLYDDFSLGVGGGGGGDGVFFGGGEG